MSTVALALSNGLVNLMEVRAASRRTSIENYIRDIVLAEAQAASASEYALVLTAKQPSARETQAP